MIRYANSEDRAEYLTYGVSQMGTNFNGTGSCCERRRRELLGGSGGMLPQKIFKSEILKTPFPAFSSQ